MKKEMILKNIQNRLVDDIKIEDQTNFTFTEDEYVSILSWVKYFNEHYKEFGKNKATTIQFPIISKRLRLDFGLYRFPSNLLKDNGEFIIYISNNLVTVDEKTTRNMSVSELIKTWDL